MGRVPDSAVMRDRRLYPIAFGAAVGLTTGLVGMSVTLLLYSNPLGGFVGAVCCGVATVYLSEESLFEDVAHAVIADSLSSVVFFFLVLAGFLSYFQYAEGLSGVTAAGFTFVYLTLGGLGVAVPIGIVSLVVAAVSGTVTALAIRRAAGPNAG